MDNYQKMTRSELNDLIRRVGRDQAQKIVLENRTVIVPDELPASDPTQPPVASGGVAGALPGPSMTANAPAPTMGGAVGGNIQTPLAQLNADLLARYEKRDALWNTMLQQGRDYINQTYRGPSTSDRLWALSKAFLAPRPYRGFAGTMYNLTQGLSGLAEERKTAEEKRQDALFKLQQQYLTGQFDNETEALKMRYQIAKEQADAERDAAKANAPKYEMTSTGEYKIRPGTGGVPNINVKGQYVVFSPEEAKNVPPGAPFIFASDNKPTPTEYYGK